MSVIKGNRIIYLYRLMNESATNDATAMAFTTENSRSKERDSDSVSTKDGPVNVPKEVETTISTTAIFSSENDAIVEKLEDAIDNATMVELWEVNLDKPGIETENKGKFASTYYHANITSFELSSGSEDHAEASLEFKVEGKGAKGYATVSDTQQQIAALVFKDTTKETNSVQAEPEAAQDPGAMQTDVTGTEEPGMME